MGGADVLPGMMPEDDFGLSLEAQELAELHGMIGSQAGATRRTPPMSVGKYRQWTLVEANRQLGQKMRAEEAALEERRKAATEAYHKARQAKTSVGAGQMKLSGDAVQKYHAELAIQGAKGKEELDAIRAKALKQKQEWAAHGARNANLHGLEQKKRVLESRAERFQARRNAAYATKQESETKKAEARERMNKALEEKRIRLEKTREGLPTPETLAEAREFFLKQKREAAAEVRKNEKGWESARKRDNGKMLEKASQNRALALECRKAVSSNRTDAVAARTAQAKAIKEKLKTLEQERQASVLATAQNGKAVHQEVYEKKFVSSEEADEVHNSEYGNLLQRVRSPGLIAKPGSPTTRDRSPSGLPGQSMRHESSGLGSGLGSGVPSPGSDPLSGLPKPAWAEPGLGGASAVGDETNDTALK